MTIDEIDFKIKSLLKERAKLSNNSLKHKVSSLKNVFGKDFKSLDGDKYRLKYFIVQELCKQGYKISYIAKEMNVAVSTISRYRDKYYNLEKLKIELKDELETILLLIKDFK